MTSRSIDFVLRAAPRACWFSAKELEFQVVGVWSIPMAKPMQKALQLGVLRLGLLQYRDVESGVFRESEEILLGGPGFASASRK